METESQWNDWIDFFSLNRKRFKKRRGLAEAKLIYQEGLVVSHEQLAKLRVWEKEIDNDPNLNPRGTKSELAGIRRMIAQIEPEIRAYN